MNITKGSFTGVGVGPGAPDLLTLRAARLIETAEVIAYPSLAGEQSFARNISRAHMPASAIEIALDIPMTTERAPAQAAYDAGAEKISRQLDAGRDVVFLCEGDPLFYGSFMYLHARLCNGYRVEIVPGVCSVMACAAEAGLPLVARNERLEIVPGPLTDAELRDRIAGAQTVAIMKVGRHLGRIRRVVRALGLLELAVYVERATLPEARVMPLADAPEDAPYFSMILLVKGGDPWL